MIQTSNATEFSFDFAERMFNAATLLGEHFDGENDTARAVIYQCCVSIEVSMKCLLEHSGMPEPVIRKHSHRLTDLLSAVDSLQFRGERIQPQHRLWGQRVSSHINGSVGLLLTEAAKGSVYPNQMRYGEQVVCIQPILMLKMAPVVLSWCRSYAGHLSCARLQSA